MAVVRKPECCPNCGLPYEAVINEQLGKDFVGDNFIRWDIEGHKCGQTMTFMKNFIKEVWNIK